MFTNPLAALPSRIAFSDDQAMLLDAATRFCQDRASSLSVRAQLGSATGFERSVWHEIVQQGWLGIAIPEAHGGSGLGAGACAVVAEALGRHGLALPFASTQLCIQGLLAGGDEAQQTAWLPRLGQGAIGTVAVFEDDGDWDLSRPACKAEPSGDQLRLHGHKTQVTDAAVADLLLVSVLLDGAPALALLPASALAASQLQAETPIDETRRSARLELGGVTLPRSALITGPAATDALQAIQRAAWLLASAEAAGGMAGALALMVDYLNTRSAFGRKIGSYQALKHGCADILVALERSRSHLHHAATMLDEALAEAADAEASARADIALRMAKAEAGDGLVQAGDRAVQFHGGFGFSYDCDAQLYLRRGLWLQAWFGDAQHQRRRLADAWLSAD